MVLAGKYLRIDLSEGTWKEVPVGENEVRQWLLGSGFAARLFYGMMDASLDPLDPRSPLLVFNGLLSGTFASTGCRSSWCGRSPLTGIWNEANMGGHWGAELRFAGYDGLVITGRAKWPVYLWINGPERTVELRDARALWGLDHFEAYDRLLEATDRRARAAVIGPAGENLVRVASVMQGGHGHSRAAGRGGMGAVMGSKNLKVIAVRGVQRPDYADREAFHAAVKENNAFIKEHSVPMSNYGTASGVIGSEKHGDMPLKNWRLGSWPEAEKISGQRIHETIWVRHTFCHACPIGCGKEVAIKEGPYAGVWGEGPEYETLAGFGGMLHNDDLPGIAAANDHCNRYGLDTISTSAIIAFATEAYEKGIITREDTGGLELAWGSTEATLALIKQIAYRRGLGNLLANGVRAAAQVLGHGAEDFAIHVKGLEIPYHDPRAFVSMAVNYATGVRGGCHLEAISYWNGYGIIFPDLGPSETLDSHQSNEAQARLAYEFQNYMSVYNPLGLCKFIAKGSVGPGRVTDLVNKAMGWDWTREELVHMGEKIFNLKRLIVLRYGISREDDTLPQRLLSEPRPTGHAAGVLPDLGVMMPIYYEMRGWDEAGVPRPQKLRELGIDL
jgi:aldehyde:ferredoxin oxidoreductase